MNKAFDRTGNGRRAPFLGGGGGAWLGVGAPTLPERGSQADQEACTPDVFRLCSAMIPDEPQILACLQSKREQLSPACGKVLEPTPDRPHRRRTRQNPT